MKVNHSIGTWFVSQLTPESCRLLFMQQNIMKVNHSIDTWFLLYIRESQTAVYATEVKFRVSILLVDYINLLEIQSAV